jgi:hypothetical protein
MPHPAGAVHTMAIYVFTKMLLLRKAFSFFLMSWQLLHLSPLTGLINRNINLDDQ